MKKKENWALGLSIVAIAISIATACFCIFRIQPFTYDSMTLTVSVLVTVVTIYMFIHIIDELFLEKRIRKSLKKDIDKRTDDILYHNMYLTFFFQGVNELRRTQCEASLYYLFKSMECLMKTSIDKDKLDEIILKVKTIKNNYPATKISKDEIKEYIKIIASTGHRDSGELIEILNSMKE
ncbi:hypothetical protein AAH091_16225 [Candidatus Bacteroides intestinigallinarum]|uniref:hypothetical protein n=1 Tax=Candidatus Bacteroides intestinigallinarum TaxID=2838470 RepID=UPI0039B647ED